MKKCVNCLKATLIVLLSSAMFFASCKDEDPKSSACDIVSFNVDTVTWTVSGLNVTHTYPPETEKGQLTPTIEVSKGATIRPASGVAQNFFATQGIKYTVTAEDGVTTQEYTVKATITQYSGCDILSFKVGTVTWTITGTDITNVYPKETVEGGILTPIITLSPGATVSPASGVAQNGFFSAAGVTYTVTAQNGTTKEYTARATKTPYSEAEIKSFTVNGAAWNIDGTEITYTYEMRSTLLTPIITLSPGATVSPASGAAQDFFIEGGIAYTVTAQDGVTKKTYIVKAIKVPFSGCDIISFTAGNADWVINGSNITYDYPAGTNSVTSLTPTITLSPGATVNPASGVAQNFFTAQGVTYTVTAENGTTKTYTVKGQQSLKYDPTLEGWSVLAKGRYYQWDDGVGSQTLWAGGTPMLILDDDPVSRYHSFLYNTLPHVLIIDMQTSKQVSKVVIDGSYFRDVELYITDNVGISGFVPYKVDWDDRNREVNYNSWFNAWNGQVPEYVPSAWNDPIALYYRPDGIDPYAIVEIPFVLPKTVEGRYLILRFPNTLWDYGDPDGQSYYCDVFSCGVYYYY
jgi:hypothetical protein